ncbi:hypothetical protein Aave_3348 [Paracidovorax citrulli AAC00-1]|uniref:Uncharacterized protein n=1 Tax=Paracidovorax citrulli (strain AAC00-1) TaxID=397945 RepID=A1TSG8_PARC0|nr:hypothetical protein Aave_3348 [Paracidovorax citrulli AAC00-1]
MSAARMSASAADAASLRTAARNCRSKMSCTRALASASGPARRRYPRARRLGPATPQDRARRGPHDRCHDSIATVSSPLGRMARGSLLGLMGQVPPLQRQLAMRLAELER